MLCEGFGRLAIDGVFGESFQLVEGGSIEKEEGRAWRWVVEETCETRWVARFEIAAWLNAGK